MPDSTTVSCAKMAEPIEMLFGFWTRVGLRKHMLHWRHLANTIEPSMSSGDVPFSSNYLTTCLFLLTTDMHLYSFCNRHTTVSSTLLMMMMMMIMMMMSAIHLHVHVI